MRIGKAKQGKVRWSQIKFSLSSGLGAGCCSAAVLQVSGLQDWSLCSLQAPDTTGCTLAGVGSYTRSIQSKGCKSMKST